MKRHYKQDDEFIFLRERAAQLFLEGYQAEAGRILRVVDNAQSKRFLQSMVKQTSVAR